MHTQRVAWLQVIDDNLAVQRDPALALTGQLLQAKARAAEDAGAETLLESDRKLHTDRGAQEAVPVDHVALPGCDLQRQDLARKLGRECKQAGPTHGRVLG